jgi:putative phosphoesterase
MKIAVFSDVHANLPALEAVYEHIRQQNPDAIYCLGDLVNQNVWNNEVIEFIQSKNIPCVLGNHDEGIANNKTKFPFSYGSWEEIDWGLKAIQFTIADVTDKNKAVLMGFPVKRNIDIETGGKKYRIVLAHGTPASNKKWIYRYYSDEELLEIMNAENANLLFIGNTHRGSHWIVSKPEEDRLSYLHIINPGSVGCPKDGSWRAAYAIVELDTNKDLFHDKDAVQVHFFKVDYDIGIVMRAIKKSPLSIYYAGRLLKQS